MNDVHSQLNLTTVRGVVRPASEGALIDVVRRTDRDGQRLCLAGGRHAMGGQQFRRDALLVDLSDLDSVVDFDRERGEIEVGAGIQWPALVRYLTTSQGDAPMWGIAQKQTGADRLSLGGTLAANAHGRGLAMAPIVADVAAFTLVDPRGRLLRCSRSENTELFRLAIGGYGLFGAMASVRLRLAPRRRLERVVEIVEIADLIARFEQRLAQGHLYGDCQYDIDLASESGLRRGVLSSYRPVGHDAPTVGTPRQLSERDWKELVRLAHVDPARAFALYAEHYLATSGQVYWSDLHQMSTYLDDYHRGLGEQLGAMARGTEMITEIYVPRDALVPFLEDVRRDFRKHRVRLVYGTIRLIETDRETFLPWARDRWACVVANLHTSHDRACLAKTARDFRRLIDRGIRYGGSYFLTYHRWARPDQVLACHPRFRGFLAQKRRFDPEERFTSDWYAHHSERLA